MEKQKVSVYNAKKGPTPIQIKIGQAKSILSSHRALTVKKSPFFLINLYSQYLNFSRNMKCELYH